MCTQETFWWILRIDVRIALEFWLLHVYRVCVIHGGMWGVYVNHDLKVIC